MRMIHLCAAGAVMAAAAPASAGFADHAEIDRAVERFTGTPIGVAGGARLPVDRRLKLATCDAPLALEWYGRAHDTVLVQCPVAGGWRLFVPVATAPGGGMAEPVVARGEQVSIVVAGSGFTLSRQGEALEGGAVGDWIRVRPTGAKADPVRVRVVAPGKVGMNLP